MVDYSCVSINLEDMSQVQDATPNQVQEAPLNQLGEAPPNQVHQDVPPNQVQAVSPNQIQKMTPKGKPPSSLHFAVQNGDAKLFREWIDYYKLEKADLRKEVNKPDTNGFCPVHYAAMFHHHHMLHKLHELGADLTKRSTNLNYTALHYAVNLNIDHIDSGNPVESDGDTDVVKFLIAKSENLISLIDIGKSTPLHLACKKGNVQVVQYIINHLQSKSDKTPLHDTLNKQNKSGNTPLHEACLNGKLEIAKKLISCDVKALDVDPQKKKKERTLLHKACVSGRYEIVEHILEELKGEKIKNMVNAPDQDDNTPFHLLCEAQHLVKLEEMEKKVVNSLLKHMNDVEAKNKNGETPLHIAARYSASMVSFLLEKHHGKSCGSVNSVNNEQQTPLISAIRANNNEACKTLILHKETELTSVGEDGRGPHHIAAHVGNFGVLNTLQGILLENEKETGLLKEQEEKFTMSRSRLGALDSHHDTPLHLAAENGHIECVKSLLRNKLYVEEQNKEQNTPLHLAAKNNRKEVVEELLKHPHEFLVNDEHNTALHLACIEGHIDIVDKILTKTKMNETVWYIRNKSERTALDEAVFKGHTEIVRYFVSCELSVNPCETVDPNEKDKKFMASPLQLAAENGHSEIVQILLQSGADVFYGSQSDTIAIVKAIQNGYESVVNVLLKDKHWFESLSLPTKEGSTAFGKLVEEMPSLAVKVLDKCSYDEKSKKKAYNYQLVDGADVTIPQKDIADETSQKDYAAETVARKDGADETIPQKKYFSRKLNVNQRIHPLSNMDFADETIPEKDGADETITQKDGADETIPQKKHFSTLNVNQRIHPLSIMAHCECKDLLTHPLVTSLLANKWKKFGIHIYVAGFIFYSIFLSFLTALSLLSPNPQSITCQAIFNDQFGQMNETVLFFDNSLNECVNLSSIYSASNIEFNVTNISDVCSTEEKRKLCELSNTDCGVCEQSSQDRIKINIIAGVVTVMAVLQICLKIFKLCLFRTQYLFDTVNLVEVPLLVSAIIFSFVFLNGCSCPFTWQWQFGCIAVLLAWIDLVIYLRVIPIGIHFIILQGMFFRFINVIFLTCALLIAFGLAFYMAFEVPSAAFDRSPFTNPFRSLMKVMPMTVGGLTYNSIFRQFSENTTEQVEEIPFIGVSYVIWILFLILMPILLSNFLTGLAVYDIQKVLDDAQIKSLKFNIEYILRIEAILQLLSISSRQLRKEAKKLKELDRFLSFITICFVYYKKINWILPKSTSKKVQRTEDSVRSEAIGNTTQEMENIHSFKNMMDHIMEVKQAMQDLAEIKNVLTTKQDLKKIENMLSTNLKEIKAMQEEVINDMQDTKESLQLALLQLDRKMEELK